MWTWSADGSWWFSTDGGQTWDAAIYGWMGGGSQALCIFCNSTAVDTSTSVQVGFIESDGNQTYVDANPGVGVSVTQTADGPTPDQTVLANVSAGAGTNQVGTSIVQNPDGTVTTQGTTFSTGAGVNLLGPWQVQIPLSYSPSNTQTPSSYDPWLIPTSDGGVVDINTNGCICLPNPQ